MSGIILSAILSLAAAPAPADDPLAGMWYDERGGLYLLKSGEGRFAWFGQGLRDGRYFMHRGSGTREGDGLEGDWIEMSNSESYPSQGHLSGLLSRDGKTISWRGSPICRCWSRKPPETIEGDEAPGREPGGPESGGGGGTAGGGWESGFEEAGEAHTDGGKPGGRPPGGAETWEGGFGDSPPPEGGRPERGGGGTGPVGSPGGGGESIDGGRPGGASGAGAGLGGEVVDGRPAWEHPGVQRAIDEWLRGARPTISEQDPGWRYNEFGQAVGGRAYVYSRPPDAALEQGRYRYLYGVSRRLPSTNMGTLWEYIRSRIHGEPIPPYRAPGGGGGGAGASPGGGAPEAPGGSGSPIGNALCGSWTGTAVYAGRGSYEGRDMKVEASFEIQPGKHGELILADFISRQWFGTDVGFVSEPTSFTKTELELLEVKGGVARVDYARGSAGSKARLRHYLAFEMQPGGELVLEHSARRSGAKQSHFEYRLAVERVARSGGKVDGK